MKAFKYVLAALAMVIGVNANAGGFRVEAPEHINPVYVKEILMNCAGEVVAPMVALKPDADIKEKADWLRKADRNCANDVKYVIQEALKEAVIRDHVHKGEKGNLVFDNGANLVDDNGELIFKEKEEVIEEDKAGFNKMVKGYGLNGYKDAAENFKDLYNLALDNPAMANKIRNMMK